MFTCKGCTEVARLVGEVEDLRKMMESLKRMFTGLRLEKKRRNMGSRGNTGRSGGEGKGELRRRAISQKMGHRHHFVIVTELLHVAYQKIATYK